MAFLRIKFGDLLLHSAEPGAFYERIFFSFSRDNDVSFVLRELSRKLIELTYKDDTNKRRHYLNRAFQSCSECVCEKRIYLEKVSFLLILILNDSS